MSRINILENGFEILIDTHVFLENKTIKVDYLSIEDIDIFDDFDIDYNAGILKGIELLKNSINTQLINQMPPYQKAKEILNGVDLK